MEIVGPSELDPGAVGDQSESRKVLDTLINCSTKT